MRLPISNTNKIDFSKELELTLPTLHFFYLLSILFLTFFQNCPNKSPTSFEGGALGLKVFILYSYATPSMLSPSLAPHVGCAIKRTLHLEVRFSDLCEYEFIVVTE